jgi:glycosyltransferase involved in cell wall biosynthesis
MRTGRNPAKSGLEAYTPKELGVALILYIPSQDGYFANALEIFKMQIASLKAATSQPYDLLVFDNGSCHAVVNALQELYKAGEITWLVLSRHNIGKAGAWNWVFASLSNLYIAYADADVLFRPGWLEASQEILKAFPQAGMVSAQPNFYDVMDGKGQAQRALENNPDYQAGPYQPSIEAIDEYCLGIGATPELAERFHQQPLPGIQHLPTETQAVLGASHMQFIIPRSIARQVIPLPATKALLRAETMSLDSKIDQLGFLHLSTRQPYVFHMGNTLNERLLAEFQQITGATPEIPKTDPNPQRQLSLARRWLSRIARTPGGRRQLQRIYNLLFQVLHSDNR